MRGWPWNPLASVRVLDGGLATELEFLGADLSGPLWSAHVLERQPELVARVHRAYLEAGAECIATASYQVSRRGYAELGLKAARADRALLRAVEIAVGERDAAEAGGGRRALVAASLGPLGAALHNGAEYHGNYDCGFDELVRFHRERIEVLTAGADLPTADLLAFETIPSLDEARAIVAALANAPEVSVWISFTCRDGEHVAHGERLRDCVAAVAAAPQVAGVGVNCVPPGRVTALLGELRAGVDLAARCEPSAGREMALLAYPNSGEAWDAEARRWTGVTDAGEFGVMAGEWFAAGAQMVGGCCRTRPEHVRAIAAAARQ